MPRILGTAIPSEFPADGWLAVRENTGGGVILGGGGTDEAGKALPGLVKAEDEDDPIDESHIMEDF